MKFSDNNRQEVLVYLTMFVRALSKRCGVEDSSMSLSVTSDDKKALTITAKVVDEEKYKNTRGDISKDLSDDIIKGLMLVCCGNKDVKISWEDDKEGVAYILVYTDEGLDEVVGKEKQ